jgi:hypothetical protein
MGSGVTLDREASFVMSDAAVTERIPPSTDPTAHHLWEGTYPPVQVGDDWQVTVYPQGNRVIRRSLQPQAKLQNEDWEHDTYIWPGWAPHMQVKPIDDHSPLLDTHAYWESVSSRIRDTAKWMATVIGSTLGLLVGTSPLAQNSTHHPQGWAGLSIGAVGLLCLVGTLMLILHVLLPQSVSFVDVLNAKDGSGPLHRWRATIVKEPDLYLPCGINSLDGLRQAIRVEELTLMALAAATHQDKVTESDVALLQEAEVARAARLRELRQAAGSIALIGEYHKLQNYSKRATILGPLLASIGTMAVIASVTLSHS